MIEAQIQIIKSTLVLRKHEDHDQSSHGNRGGGNFSGPDAFWVDKFKEVGRLWGKSSAIDRARSQSAGSFLGRDFGESADSFYKKNPKLKMLSDWIQAGFPGLEDKKK